MLMYNMVLGDLIINAIYNKNVWKVTFNDVVTGEYYTAYMNYEQWNAVLVLSADAFADREHEDTLYRILEDFLEDVPDSCRPCP